MSCDNAIPADVKGVTGACPTSCPETPSLCLIAKVVGSAADCTARCVVSEVTVCSLVTDDNCCPAGCTPANDLNCAKVAARCGDGICQVSESCDQCFSDCGPCPGPTVPPLLPLALDLAAILS